MVLDRLLVLTDKYTNLYLTLLTMIITRQKIEDTTILKNSTGDYLNGCPAWGIVHIFSIETDKISEYEELWFTKLKNSDKSIDTEHVDEIKLDTTLLSNKVEVVGDISVKVKAYLDNYLDDDILKDQEVIEEIDQTKVNQAIKDRFTAVYDHEKQLLIIASALSKISEDKDLLDMVAFYAACVSDPFLDKKDE